MTIQDKLIIGNDVGVLVSTETFLGLSSEIDRKNERCVELQESLLFNPELVNLCLLGLHDKFKKTLTERLVEIHQDTFDLKHMVPNCKVVFVNKGERFAIVSRDDVDLIHMNTWEILVRESTGIPAHLMKVVCNSMEIIEKEDRFLYFADRLQLPVHVA